MSISLSALTSSTATLASRITQAAGGNPQDAASTGAAASSTAASSSDDSDSDSLAMSMLKKQIAQLKKQIAERQQALQEVMADDQLPAEQKREQARAIQSEVAALQLGMSQAYQSLRELLETEGGTTAGSQLDALA